MRRRDFTTLVGSSTLWPLATRAQPAAKMLRVGTANAQPRTAPQWVAFINRMAELGYREGDNFIYDHVQIPNASSWESSYREVMSRKPDILVGAGPEISLAELAIQHRLLAMYDLREFVTAGSLMSYGPSLTGMFALAAGYVDRIAKGARPADLPVEQPTKFELVLNVKTARVMNLTLPPTLLARVDEEID